MSTSRISLVVVLLMLVCVLGACSSDRAVAPATPVIKELPTVNPGTIRETRRGGGSFPNIRV